MLRNKFFSKRNLDNITLHSTNQIYDAVKSAIEPMNMSAKVNIIGLESIVDPQLVNTDQQTALHTYDDVQSSLMARLSTAFGGEQKVLSLFGVEGLSAATTALLVANGSSYMSEGDDVPTVVPTNKYLVSKSGFSQKGKLSNLFGRERFDDMHVAPYRVTTTALQLTSMNQSGYISLAFPIVLLGASEFGFDLEIPRGTIQDRNHIRNDDATPIDIRKLSIIAQYRNVGEDVAHANRLHPVVRPENAKWLTAYDNYGAVTHDKSVVAAPVKVGYSFDYIRASQPDGYVEFGPTSISSSLAPGGSVTNLYLAMDKENTDIVKINTSGVSGAMFVFENTSGIDSNSQRMTFEMTHIFNKDNIKNLDGVTDSAGLRKLITLDETIYMILGVTCTLLLENGTLSTAATKPRIDKIFNANGVEIPRSKWTADQLAFDTTDVHVDGALFDLRLSNTNLEIFGDIVHVDSVKIHYETTINHPVSIVTTIDAKDSPALLNQMTQAVKLNNHKMATLTLLNSQYAIKQLAANPSPDPVRVQGACAGLLCYLPAYKYEEYDISKGINNDKSGELLNDVSGALRAMMKHMISELMRDSLYVQAVRSSYVIGENQKGVKIGIITSQYIADFLQIKGYALLLGDEYTYEVEVNPSAAFDNKIMMFPTTEDNGKSEISPLQFGLSIQNPEVIYDTVATYNGQHIKEFRYMNRWCPHRLGAVMGVIDVKGLREVISERIVKAVHTM